MPPRPLLNLVPILTTASLALFGASALAQDAASLSGQDIWVESGCGNCHGARGEGGSSHDFPDGPSLRTSELDAEALAEVIACGIPSTEMPAWQVGAYLEVECFGISDGPPERTQSLELLSRDEVDALTAFIIERMMR